MSRESSPTGGKLNLQKIVQHAGSVHHLRRQMDAQR